MAEKFNENLKSEKSESSEDEKSHSIFLQGNVIDEKCGKQNNMIVKKYEGGELVEDEMYFNVHLEFNSFIDEEINPYIIDK